MVPYLEDEKLWGNLFLCLKQHLVNSPLWQHYDELKKKLIDGENPYGGEFIIKPSTFKFITRAEDDIIPMYGVIER